MINSAIRHGDSAGARRAPGLLLATLLAATAAGPDAIAAGGAASGVVHPARWPAAHSVGLSDPATEARITALLGAMSLEEKVGQVIQADISSIRPEDLRKYPLGSILAGGGSGPYGDERASPERWLQLTREFHAVAVEQRPGHVPVPVIFGVDAVHGHNNVVGAVQFPHNSALGATHDPDLLRRIGAATAEEVAATGVDWTFAPAVAVPQDIRWGRAYEGYGQDPALVARCATALVEGLQGPAAPAAALQSGHVAATAKHFMADGGTLRGEDQGDAPGSEDELVRVHAPGYASTIDAGVMTVMASFSTWHGQKMHGNRALLTDVLKGRMGFEGFVVGDWNGYAQLPGCSKAHCPDALDAGLDMYMAPDEWRALFDNTLADVRAGRIPQARLEDAVRRILRVKFRLGLFEAGRPLEGKLEQLGSPAHRALAREAVRKSLVLLKNDGVLPVRGSARVLVTGPGARNIGMQCGGWCISWQGADTTNADFPHGESIEAGIRAAVEASGGRLMGEAGDSAAPLLGTGKPDVAIVVFGESPYAEFAGDIKYALYNPGNGLEIIRNLRRQGIPVVSVFLSGRPLQANAEINASNAFVAAWWPGTEGGGVADLLIGDAQGRPRADFSGRLSFAWPTAPAAQLGGATLPPAKVFRPGYGLRYAAGGTVPRLPED